MALTQQENALFVRWEKTLPPGQFVRDGVIDEHTFARQEIKIIFLLKDPVGTVNSQQDLRAFAVEPGKDHKRKQVWNNIALWTELFLAGPVKEAVQYHQIDEQKQIEMIKKIGWINIKKTPGTTNANNDLLKKFLKNNLAFVREQLHLYKPNLVVCCHSTQEWANMIFSKTQNDWHSPGCLAYQSEGFHYLLEKSFWPQHACLVLDCQHPGRKGEKYFNELSSFWTWLRQNGILKQAGIL